MDAFYYIASCEVGLTESRVFGGLVGTRRARCVVDESATTIRELWQRIQTLAGAVELDAALQFRLATKVQQKQQQQQSF